MKKSSGALDAAIVRVLSATGDILGAGFLVGSREVLTCAHVVSRALDGDAAQQAMLRVDFPLLAPGKEWSAEVVAWHPSQADETGDVAGLRLTAAPPLGAHPARLVIAPDVWGHPFRAFGFPAGHDGGVWTSGRLLGRQATGWIQLDDDRNSGFPVAPGFSGTPVWDAELDGVVGMAVAAEARPSIRTAYLIPSGTLVELWPELGTHAVPPCPYRGLAAFREQDAHLYHGRDELTTQLAGMATSVPLGAVVGPSGSGKSSLVFAGALPRLRQRPGLVIASCRPAAGASPLSGLAGALLPLLEGQMSESDRLVELPKLAAVLGEGRLAEVVDRVLTKADATQLLLVVDQFEELFGRGQPVAHEFIDVLLGALRPVPGGRPGPLHVLLTLRADFLGQALQHPGLADRLRDSVLAIGGMTRQQLERVIEEPAAGVATYEAGLVERILDDVGAEPGNLPLLEFALTLLWDRQDRGRLTHAAYDELGEAPGALAGYAERVYLTDLPEPQRTTARRVLTQLVRPGEASEPTKRMARRTDFDDAQWAVAQSLAGTRLIVAGRSPDGSETLELAHEALIGEWDRLHEWVEADRAFRSWQERLRIALAQWEGSGRNQGALLGGLPLAESEQWIQERPTDISQVEQAFIRASRLRQRRAIRRLQVLIAGITVLLLVASTLGYRQVGQNRLATSRLLVDQAQDRADQPDVSILLSLAAFRTSETAQTRGALLEQYLAYRDVDTLLAGHPGPVNQFVLSLDGQRMASLDAGGNVWLWDLTQARPEGKALESPADDTITALALSPDGQTLATGDSAGVITFWDTATAAPREPAADAPEFAGVPLLRFSPDGKTLASLDLSEGQVMFWDVARGSQSRPPLQVFSDNGDDVTVSGVWYGPDSQTLITYSTVSESFLQITTEIVIWGLTDGRRTVLPTDSRAGSSAITVSGDGRRLALLEEMYEPDFKTTIKVWDLTIPGLPSEFQLDERLTSYSSVSDIGFDPQGERLVINLSGRVLIWDAIAGQPREFVRYPGYGRVEFGSGDRTLVTTIGNGIALLRSRAPHLDGIASAFGGVFSPDGRRIATVDIDGAVSIRDVASDARVAGRPTAPAQSSFGTPSARKTSILFAAVASMASTPCGSRRVRQG